MTRSIKAKLENQKVGQTNINTCQYQYKINLQVLTKLLQNCPNTWYSSGTYFNFWDFIMEIPRLLHWTLKKKETDEYDYHIIQKVVIYTKELVLTFMVIKKNS